MDTRNKIIDPERAAGVAGELRARGSGMKVVTGYFDVVVAGHVRRLREIRDGAGTLFVVVVDPPDPVLARRARAELVAALGMVDYVVPAEKLAARELLSHFHQGEIIREESADLLRARSLSEHVQRRHKH